MELGPSILLRTDKLADLLTSCPVLGSLGISPLGFKQRVALLGRNGRRSFEFLLIFGMCRRP